MQWYALQRWGANYYEEFAQGKDRLGFTWQNQGQVCL